MEVAMKPIILAVIISTSIGWQVNFTARRNNVGVQFDTACFGSDGHLSFIAVDYIQVDGSTSSVPFRRHEEVPKRDACSVIAHIFANDHKGDTFFGADPSGDYIIESTPHVDQK
jgi:hypothetical protein